MIYTLIPAYGRDYRNKKEMMDDWNSGKDFCIATGSYINISDAAELFELKVRYGNLRKLTVIKKDKEGKWK